jgi:hypothetical protein
MAKKKTTKKSKKAAGVSALQELLPGGGGKRSTKAKPAANIAEAAAKSPEVQPARTDAVEQPESEAVTAQAAKPNRRKSDAPKHSRAEHVAVLDLEPAADIKPVRAGSHLADVLRLTARPEGATAVELDEAIVTTAKSVKHYGIWALRYALHKQKGFGFRTVEKKGEPARYLLVLPNGAELATFLKAAVRKEAKGERRTKAKAEPVAKTKSPAKVPKGEQGSKRRGSKVSVHVAQAEA